MIFFVFHLLLTVVCTICLALDKLNFKEEVIQLTDATVCCYCSNCGDELCIGERFYRIGLRKLCTECLKEYALDYFAASLEIAE